MGQEVLMRRNRPTGAKATKRHLLHYLAGSILMCGDGDRGTDMRFKIRLTAGVTLRVTARVIEVYMGGGIEYAWRSGLRRE